MTLAEADVESRRPGIAGRRRLSRTLRPGGEAGGLAGLHIPSDPMICHGKACITGARVMATVILDNMADGLTVEDIMRSYPPVSRDAVQATLHYAGELARERGAPLAL